MKRLQLLTAVLTACILFTGCVTVTSDGKPLKKEAPQNTTSKEIAQMLNDVKGEYRELDSEKTNRLVQKISDGDIDVIKSVMNDPNSYEPPVLFAYANQVFQSGHYDTAMFWYYTAQLRARSDANKSKDNTVQNGVTNLSKIYGTSIGQYAIEHPDNLEETKKKVLEWDEISERKYNPKWVAILGNEAKIRDKIRFVTPDQYKIIDNEVRRGWRIGFEAAIKEIKARHNSKE